MFVQVVEGLEMPGAIPGRTGRPAPCGPRSALSGKSQTLMRVVIVGFLTVIIGHVGRSWIPSA